MGRGPLLVRGRCVTLEIWRTDIQCLQCSRVIGRVDLESEDAPIPLYVSRMRCQVCGGQPMRGDALCFKPQEEVVVEWGKRPGRPPNRLRELIA